VRRIYYVAPEWMVGAQEHKRQMEAAEAGVRADQRLAVLVGVLIFVELVNIALGLRALDVACGVVR
jgi:hypothetical protein